MIHIYVYYIHMISPSRLGFQWSDEQLFLYCSHKRHLENWWLDHSKICRCYVFFNHPHHLRKENVRQFLGFFWCLLLLISGVRISCPLLASSPNEQNVESRQGWIPLAWIDWGDLLPNKKKHKSGVKVGCWPCCVFFIRATSKRVSWFTVCVCVYCIHIW